MPIVHDHAASLGVHADRPDPRSAFARRVKLSLLLWRHRSRANSLAGFSATSSPVNDRARSRRQSPRPPVEECLS